MGTPLANSPGSAVTEAGTWAHRKRSLGTLLPTTMSISPRTLQAKSAAVLLAFACTFAEVDGLAIDWIERPAAKVIRVGPHRKVPPGAEAAAVARHGDGVES